MERMILVIAALAVVLAACGGSESDGVATLEDAEREALVEDIEDAAGDASDEEALLAFAQCMRDNGVENFQDPVVDADGSVGFAFGGGGGGNQDGGPFGGVGQEVVQAAFQACSDNLENVAFGPGGGDFDQEEFQDTFIEFTACLREEGLEIDDPDFSNFGPGQGGGDNDGGGPGGFRGQLDIDDPEVQAALEACQDIFGGFGPGGGGLRGGGGGNG